MGERHGLALDPARYEDARAAAIEELQREARARARRGDLDRVHREDRPRHGRRRGRRQGVRDRHGAGVGAARELLALRGCARRPRRASPARAEDRAGHERAAGSRGVRRPPRARGGRDGRIAAPRQDEAASVDLRRRAPDAGRASPRKRRWWATPTRTTSRAPARSACGRSCSIATACARTSPSGSTRCSRFRPRSVLRCRLGSSRGLFARRVYEPQISRARTPCARPARARARRAGVRTRTPLRRASRPARRTRPRRRSARASPRAISSRRSPRAPARAQSCSGRVLPLDELGSAEELAEAREELRLERARPSGAGRLRSRTCGNRRARR